MTPYPDWRRVHEFWFPADLSTADLPTHWRMLTWWMGGGASAELTPMAPILADAKAGRLDHWTATPQGRLSLVIVLDQFSRGLDAGSPAAYSCDRDALHHAEEGFRKGHYEALGTAPERLFFLLPLAHTEGPGHLDRLRRVVAASERLLEEAPAHLKPVWEFSLSQARANLDVIARFGRYPHRNPILRRTSTPEEAAYIAQGDFVHQRRPAIGELR